MRQESKEIGACRSREKVINRTESHIDLKLMDLVREAISGIEINQKVNYLEKEVFFDLPIGECEVVETNPDDKIVFRERKNRKGLSRFVVNRQKEQSNILTIVLKRAKEDPRFLTLITAYIDPKAPPEPYDKMADEKAKDYWKTHAFVRN
jgi:hypothetical protein